MRCLQENKIANLKVQAGHFFSHVNTYLLLTPPLIHFHTDY